jgi:DNA-binding CsgD family transcriptional regulator
MKLSEDIVESIISGAHAAALGAQPWSDLLQKLAQALGGNGAAMFTPMLDPVGRSLAADCGTAADATRGYLRHWVLEDPWIEAAVARGAWKSAGAISAGRQLVELQSLYRTAFFNDFSRRHEIHELVSLKAVGEDDAWAPVTHFSIFSSQPDAFEREHVDALRQLWPHLQRAIQTYWVLQKARTTDQAAHQALDALAYPVWILRAGLEIDFANQAARSWMAAPRGRLVAGGPGNGRLLAIGDLDTAALRLALAQVQTTGGCLLAAALADGPHLRRALLRVAAVPRNSPYAVAWPAATALVVLHPPPGPEEAALWHRHLARRFGLTATESRVLAAIGASQSPDEIAADLGVSVTTVRSHLARLFDKTGCRRQVDLVRLFSGH